MSRECISVRQDNNFQFEHKAYGPDSTEEEIQAIKDQASIYEQGIIYLKALPIGSPFSADLMLGQAMILGSQFSKYGLLLDLRNTQRPDAITRRKLDELFTKLGKEVNHVSFFTGTNILFNTTLKLILHELALSSYSIHSDHEEAINTIKQVING